MEKKKKNGNTYMLAKAACMNKEEQRKEEKKERVCEREKRAGKRPQLYIIINNFIAFHNAFNFFLL